MRSLTLPSPRRGHSPQLQRDTPGGRSRASRGRSTITAYLDQRWWRCDRRRMALQRVALRL